MLPAIALAPLTLADAPYYHRLTGDITVMAYITGEAYTVEESFEEVKRLTQKFAGKHPWGVWVARQADTSVFVGVGALIPVENEWTADIGYRVLPDFWGQAYGQAIALSLLEKARQHNIRRLIATVEIENQASIAIVNKMGFVLTNQELNERGLPEGRYELML